MKARDQRAVSALRSALAAIDNAEAVGSGAAAAVHAAGAGETAEAAETVGAGKTAGAETAGAETAGVGETTEARIAGAVVGVGAAEVERRTLTPAEVQAIVRGEVAERRTAAEAYARAGQTGYAERLRAEAEVLSAYLDEPGSGRRADPET
jgi:uncharacterized protein